MAKIRTDIFPKMLPFIGKKKLLFKIYNVSKESEEAFLKRYIANYRQKKLRMFASEAYQGIRSQFQSKKDFIDYINSFVNPEIAELFITSCKFYFISKKYQCASYIKLIMIISIIEKTISKDKKWKEFHSWIFEQRSAIQKYIDGTEKINQKSFLRIINELKEEYFKEYGSQRNVVDFFKKYVTTDYQIKLIKAFRANYTKAIENFDPHSIKLPDTIEEASKITKKPIEHMMMPYCFNWKKCLVYYRDCGNSESCELNNKALLEETLEKVVKDIYQIRNDFVHMARITPLVEYDGSDAEDSFSIVLGVIGSKYKPISIRITIKEFESMFEQALKKYFNAYIKNV